MSPKQCRAARALLDMTQPELAALAGLGLSTVVDFEKERRIVSDHAAKTLASALEGAGVVLLAEGEIEQGGDGVRLKVRIKSRGD
ncbi:helix-turn-helix transcriptional regulator [Methylopila sp. M107]|uniref:helix-turn-helix transcriptional regulator n=1 Tax=Methylopila sp. M107 TaxID=1101190 RepID=UPI00037578F8|nr:helix-turn-helix transcriptional regulator [Methylopila sp. M107]